MSENQDKVPEALPGEAQSKQAYRTSDNTRNHYLELDALRGIAILGVFTVHATALWTSATEVPLNIPIVNFDPLRMVSLGGLGVTLFFLLSGYLLSWTEEKRARNANYSLRSYALRRAFRLLPAYYLALILGFLLWPAGKTFVDVAAHLTLMQGFVPHLSKPVFDPVFWSLTPEIVFYVLLPLLILKMRGLYPRLALMGVLLAAAFATRLYMFLYASPGEWLYLYLDALPTAHLWVFIVGVLLRMMVERVQEGGSILGFRFRSHLASSLLGVVSVGLILALPFTQFQEPLAVALTRLVADSLAAMFFAAVLLGSPWLLALLRWRVLAFIGTISYSLFLLHYSILYAARVYGLPEIRGWFIPWLRQQGDLTVLATFTAYFGAILLFCIAISYLSYRYVESPFLQRKPKK